MNLMNMTTGIRHRLCPLVRKSRFWGVAPRRLVCLFFFLRFGLYPPPRSSVIPVVMFCYPLPFRCPLLPVTSVCQTKPVCYNMLGVSLRFLASLFLSLPFMLLRRFLARNDLPLYVYMYSLVNYIASYCYSRRLVWVVVGDRDVQFEA